MSFSPALPIGGYGGWKFLQRTMPQQKEAMLKSPSMARDLKHFRENIGNVKTAEDLVNDRQLLRVALGAFGLDADINSRFFIKKILESDPADRTALANKLGDKRYGALAKAFGFGAMGGANTYRDSFQKDIVDRYTNKRFESAVGERDPDLRLALNLKQALADATKGTENDKAQWYRVLGTPPLRAVFEKALGLPKSIGSLDLDLQMKQFRQRANSVLGTDNLTELAKPEAQEDLTRTFLMRAQLAQFNAGQSSAQNAMMLLSQIQFPKVGIY